MLRFTDIPDANILWILDFTATIFSLFGSITMIFSCFKAPSPKTLYLKFITAIGFANLLYSVANLLSNFEENDQSSEFDLCSYEAVLRQFSYTLLIFLSTCIAVATCYSIQSINQPSNKTLFFYSSVVTGLVISFLYFTIVPGLFENHIVIAQGPFYCWFTYSSNPSTSMFMRILITGTFQGLPVFIGFILTVVAYLLVKKQIRNLSRGVLENSYLRVLKVFWFPAILFAVFVPTVIDCILRIYVEERSVWMNAMFLVFPHAIGFIHAVLYGIQTKFGQKKYEDFGSTSNEESNSIYLSFARSSS